MDTSKPTWIQNDSKGDKLHKTGRNYSVPNEWGHQSILTFLFKAIHWLLNCQTHHFLHDSTTHMKTESGLFTCEKKDFKGCYKHHLVTKAQHGQTTFFVFS
jgi:hypothetical protein